MKDFSLCRLRKTKGRKGRQSDNLFWLIAIGRMKRFVKNLYQKDDEWSIHRIIYCCLNHFFMVLHLFLVFLSSLNAVCYSLSFFSCFLATLIYQTTTDSSAHVYIYKYITYTVALRAYIYICIIYISPVMRGPCNTDLVSLICWYKNDKLTGLRTYYLRVLPCSCYISYVNVYIYSYIGHI